MKNLLRTINVGYEIVSQGEEAVVGYNPEKDEWVAWTYMIENGKAEYCWGRYGSREYAYDCFRKKENNEYSGN